MFLESKIMKTLKISALSGVNIGDLAISHCLERVLDTTTVVSADLRLREKKLFNSSALTSKKKNSILDVIKNNPLLYNLSLKLKYQLTTKKKLNSVIHDYDNLLIGGGNLLFNKNGIDFLDSCFSSAKLFHKHGKPFSVISVGVGPFTCPHKKQLEFLVNNSNFFSVRDETSKNLLISILGKEYSNKINVLPDPVILYSRLYNENIDFSQGFDWFGVNAIDLVKSPQDSKIVQDFKEMAKNIIRLSIKLNLKPKLISTAYNNDPETLLLLKKYLDELSEESHEILYLEEKDIGNLCDKFIKCKFILSYRMHLGILANSIGIPTLTYKWQPKIEGVTKQYIDNPELFLLSEPNFDFDEILAKLNSIKHISNDSKLDIIHEKYKKVTL